MLRPKERWFHSSMTMSRKRTLACLRRQASVAVLGRRCGFIPLPCINHMTAGLRYEPKHFAGLSSNNLHGFYSNLDWSRDISSKLASTFDFTGDHYNLPSLNLVNIVANLNLRFQLSRHWVLISGASYGRSASRLPPGPAISS